MFVDLTEYPFRAPLGKNRPLADQRSAEGIGNLK